MNINKRILVVLFTAITVYMGGCTVKYSFSGINISPEAKTVSIAYFPNNAPLVAPSLSSTLTDELRDRFSRNTRLDQTDENGDLQFEGEITNYTSTPAIVSGQTEQATMNRLTVTIKVSFVNNVEPQYSFSGPRTFSAYEDYSVNTPLQTAEQDLIPQIVETLVNDIFNASVSNW